VKVQAPRRTRIAPTVEEDTCIHPINKLAPNLILMPRHEPRNAISIGRFNRTFHLDVSDRVPLFRGDGAVVVTGLEGVA
jgi:hypothetical protein